MRERFIGWSSECTQMDQTSAVYPLTQAW